MRPRDVRVYLFDIKRSAEAIGQFVRGKSLEDYLADLMLRSAVERQFEIIGEALSQACAAEPRLGEEIREARAIVGFRNRVIHGYADADDEIVWENIARLPSLLADVERALVTRS
ncbi:MAG TPA: HepT-like ribonuclease domain-containing protein [Coriobacteriia bacterium]|jgi:uncharacterized protein with HEPN domain